jgi:23S rRNA (uracil1939-C5)-methyltransferase
MNGIENIQFYQGDAGDFMTQMSQEDESLDLVFMDPPRSGSDDAFLSSLIKLAPKTVIYISCGPDSLARDLKVLTNNGYKVKEMFPYDMFPWTDHVEVVCRLTK